MVAYALEQVEFLSTPSARRATITSTNPPGLSKFLSTPSARRATCHADAAAGVLLRISIHALREEGDFLRWSPDCRDQNFYPRPPRGGRRDVRSVLLSESLFLSTPSARRATLVAEQTVPCGNISIHALREEGDRTIVSPRAPKLNFYPRPPRGGRPPAGPLPECRH